ncbi:AAA family ATPase [Kineosporia babensis]|uniref:ATP-binding protein n=1 Tax=Kineosporia babensis TaxID=499548 RepID=A0A9X1SWR5_9ACTN|nr:ATP-binding protein [Kineosporia babensis]MCD5314320.1 ATP-binding protein [Kineosporia babensis]
MVLTCGLAGSGKSTYARSLEAQGWLRLSIDQQAWDQGFTTHPLPPEIRLEIIADQRRQLAEALDDGHDVVVDYAFFSRAMRDEYRAIAQQHGAEVEVALFDVPREELLRRLAGRGSAGPDDIAVPAELLDRFIAGFEWPTADETDVHPRNVHG